MKMTNVNPARVKRKATLAMQFLSAVSARTNVPIAHLVQDTALMDRIAYRVNQIA